MITFVKETDIAAPLTAARRNVELKAVDCDPSRSLAICRSLQAEDRGVIHQRDTYFDVRSGRLKLREETPGRPHLIHYERSTGAGARPSEYRIVEFQQAAELRALLAAALGVRSLVMKRRRLFLWRGVRIHLDDVDGLGHFIELEAVARADSDLATEHRLVTELQAAFAITDELLCGDSYADW